MSQPHQGHINHENARTIPISLITPSRTNKHTGERFKRSKLQSLAASIKSGGIIQPLLVRPISDPARPGKEFVVVAGERRYRAAEIAELGEVPCIVTELCEAAALEVQLTENLQREDLHPLDEAQSFLRLQKEAELDEIEIGQRVGLPAREVARRLKLNNLVKEGKADFRAGYITFGHAIEICVYSPEVQRAALAACYKTQQVWDEEAEDYVPVPDKANARTVEQLQDWLRANVQLNLRVAPFKTTDARLREDGLTCVECPNRTGYNTTLFADVKNADTCLNPICYKAKVQTFVQIRRAELSEKRETPAPLVSPYWNTSEGEGEGENEVIPRSRYATVEDKDERCEYAEQALYVEGEPTGKTAWICREPTCKDHLGRVRGHASVAVTSSASGGQQQGDTAKRNARKQELFDVKVDEEVRLRVFTEALKTFSYPLDRSLLDMVAVAHFRRIPSADQKTIVKVLGLSDEDGNKLRGYGGSEGVRLLATWEDDRVAQFMVLCSIAHFGANQYGNRRVSQEMVTSIAQVRGVNHGLIDAEVRHERCAKKYKSAHAAYLAAVREGREATLPTVYEQQPQAATASQQTEKAA